MQEIQQELGTQLIAMEHVVERQHTAFVDGLDQGKEEYEDLKAEFRLEHEEMQKRINEANVRSKQLKAEAEQEHRDHELERKHYFEALEAERKKWKAKEKHWEADKRKVEDTLALVRADKQCLESDIEVILKEHASTVALFQEETQDHASTNAALKKE